MTVAAYVKDPQERSDFPIDWTERLAPGDSVIASTWTVPAGLTSDTPTFSAAGTNIWLSGGTLGTEYLVINHVTTQLGYTFDQQIIVLVVNT